MIDYNTFHVEDIDDAIAVIDEVLDDFNKYGWVEVSREDYWGRTMIDALKLIKRWVKYKQNQRHYFYNIDNIALDATYILNEREENKNERHEK